MSNSGGMKHVTIDVLASEHDALVEHVEQFRIGGTPAQLAAEIRFIDGEESLDCLADLMQVAQGADVQGLVATRFLASASRGVRVPFDLTELRHLDEKNLERCLRVLRLASTGGVAIETYFPDGRKIFDALEQRAIYIDEVMRGLT